MQPSSLLEAAELEAAVRWHCPPLPQHLQGEAHSVLATPTAVLLQLEDIRAANNRLMHQLVALQDEFNTMKQQVLQLEAWVHTAHLENITIKAESQVIRRQLQTLDGLLEHVCNNGEMPRQAAPT